jgi:nucleoside-diphosphate-sugar epimerase
MKIAITGGTGFVGRNLARLLSNEGHQVILIARGSDSRDQTIRSLPSATFAPIGTGSPDQLAQAFAGCDAVAHCAGINREIAEQTYQRVHVQGTQNVIEAAKTSGVKKILLLSFLRARPNCGSAYHESKWAAEEIVRNSGLDYTIIKAGMIYGKGDHMLDHLTHTLHSLPLFGRVGMKEKPIRPVAVEDVARILYASLVVDRLSRETVAVIGPHEMFLSDAVKQVARITGRRVFTFPFPVLGHRILAWIFERTLTIPLISSAQVFMLSETMVEPLPKCSDLPRDLTPTTHFKDEQLIDRLPEAKPFGRSDFRCFAAKP